MNSLDYLKRSRELETVQREKFPSSISVTLMTNFTDDILKNLFTGVALSQNVYPDIFSVPYRQYHLHLKDPASELYERNADITFIFFDVNPFKESEFRSRAHFEEALSDIRRYASAVKGTVVVNAFISSYQSAYGNLTNESPLFALVREYNEQFEKLAAELPNVRIFDTNRLVHVLGESHVFDQRGLFAFDIPFSSEFMTLLAEEWFAYVRALTGKVKKAIVLDLDNTLWGGVVGELGPTGIALGPDYPGNAFVNFQKVLLDFYNRGIILAINSKNNPADVAEVFAKNPHMVLKEQHFSAIRTNWNDKTANIIDIANELNIGVDSMVFIDDDPLHRAVIAGGLPEVAVPDWSLPPEEYAKTLYGLNLFHQFSLTEEDKQKGKMYAEERQRKQTFEVAKDISEYIAALNIVVDIKVNDPELVPRLAQMTQKTNQFNLTTRRYAEHDIKKFIADGGFIFSANVTDKFGDYGTVVMAIVTSDATLDSFLMSCRVMGRGVECVFMDYIIRDLARRGFKKLRAEFIPTAKNKPAETFLTDHGFKDGAIDIPAYLKHPCQKVNKAIIISE